MSRFKCFLVTGLMMSAAALPASAANIYCTVVGTTQGKLQGDPGLHGDATQIPVYAITEELTVPFDAASGQASGRRQHSPLTIVKELDASSPQFFSAAATGETLRSVTCTLYRSGGTGATQPYYKIALTNAIIVAIKDRGDGVNGAAVNDERERISFTYQKIEFTDLASSTTAVDDWTTSD
jgi:type VI secretion system secreted protein Hcp